jgi:CO/xanthine dehydrogenase FAD-binding subunit
LKERFTIPYFDYDAPATLSDATRILSKYGRNAALAAGGTTLLVDLKRGDRKPPKMLVDISHLRGLEFVKFNQRSGLRIGALTRLQYLEQSKAAQENYPAIVEAIRRMGTVQVCNMASVGGNICSGSPCSDLAVPFLVLDAVLTLRSHGKERKVKMENVYTGPYATCVKPNEILTEIQIPYIKDCGMAFERFGRTAVDLGLAKVAVLVKIGPSRKCSLFRLAIGTATEVIAAFSVNACNLQLG